jgi:NAD(P)-dependent dehydrogenase (short-subunit alcohol dehydrogenase family)
MAEPRMAEPTGRSALVVGVGHASGVGAAVARRFARGGFDVTIFGRNESKLATALESLRSIAPSARAEVGDVTDEAAVRRLVAESNRVDAPLEVAVFNAGGNWRKAYLEMDAAFLEEMWRVNALSGFFFSKAAVEAMLPRGRGTLIFTGASGSLRGRASFGGFAQAKAALRALAQSCAREFGPRGLHVAHVVIDGAVDGDRIRTLLPQLKDRLGADGLLDPDAIAESYWHIYTQPRSAWTHELDLRPWAETW